MGLCGTAGPLWGGSAPPSKVKLKLCNRVFCGGASHVLPILKISGHVVAPCEAEKKQAEAVAVLRKIETQARRALTLTPPMGMQIHQFDRACRYTSLTEQMHLAAPLGAGQATKIQRARVEGRRPAGVLP